MKRNITLLALVFATTATAQQAGLTLEKSVQLAITQGAEIQTARTNLVQAQTNLKALETDPSTPIDALLKAQNTLQLETVRLPYRKLEVMQSALEAHLALLEANENLDVLMAQLGFDKKNVEVAKSRLTNKVGTPLEVQRSENQFNQTQQALSDLKAQLPILSNRLEAVIRVKSEAVLNALTPKFQEFKLDRATLEKNLEERLPSVIEAKNTVEELRLLEQIYDNDYTPVQTLREVKTNLGNAQRGLENAQKTVLTGLRNALRTAADAFEQVRLRQRDFENANVSLSQDQAKFKAGTISGVQLQQSKLETTKAGFAGLQAQGGYWRAIAGICVASGIDVSGLVREGQ
jgi:outer membrane protein